MEDGKEICPICGHRHTADRPHLVTSAKYQALHLKKYGRYASWEDALRYCPEEVKNSYINAIKMIGGDPTKPIRPLVKAR